eukprot:TRINITY_DN26696_c0_g1_i1.p1 TRINITY_DN26696_c0_g1~~TRINITY_DN26696_c0_g1_i1.p1  ORF type:complete len:247 (+),score=54.26 TRINITY_DN26696_c0_g1_i1:139-879(+)
MATLEASRAQVALLALFLSKAEARDKLCRAIQYGSKFVSGGEKGTAQDVEKSTSLARKVFRLLKSVNEIQNLLTPAPASTPLPLVLLGRAKSALLATFLALDQVVWLGRTGIYKNKENTDLISRVSLYCWMYASVTGSVIEVSELFRLSGSLKTVDRELRKTREGKSSSDEGKLLEQRKAHTKKFSDRSLNYIKSSLDILVAIGLLQLAPKTVTPRVTGALGVITSVISCYQLFPPPPAAAKAKTS